MAVAMSQLKKVTLSDNEVTRMIAAKAMNDQAFKDTLCDYIGSQISNGSSQTRGKKFQALVQSITEFRKQIADQAGLQAPKNSFGDQWDLNTYLKQVTHSRVLVAKDSAQEEQGTKVISDKGIHKWGWVGSPTSIARLALDFLQSTLRFQADPNPFPFERLPPELRLQVYHEVLSGPVRDGVAVGQKIVVFCNKNNNFLFRFEGQQKGEAKEIYASLLATNRLVYNEAVPILYRLHTFDFMTNVGSIKPFLSSLPEEARQNLHGIAMELHVKLEPDYCCGRSNNYRGKSSGNQAAWGRACVYVAENVNVKKLSLTINVKVHAAFKSLKWVKALVKIKSLKHLTLQVDQHYPNSPLLTKASYKDGLLLTTEHCFSEHLVPLFEYLREEMLE